MKTEQLIEAIEGANLDWRNYSGRGMYGKSCVAVEVESIRDLFDLGQVLTDADKPEIDQLGLRYIVYWPRCKVEETTGR